MGKQEREIHNTGLLTGGVSSESALGIALLSFSIGDGASSSDLKLALVAVSRNSRNLERNFRRAADVLGVLLARVRLGLVMSLELDVSLVGRHLTLRANTGFFLTI